MTSTTSAMTSSSAAGVSTMTSAAVGPSTSSIASSSSQYLHPEYIQLMPSSLDAKNSPLALLAQTCSSIGRDPTPPPSKSHSSSSSSGSSSGCGDNRKDSQYHHGKEAVDAGGKMRQKSESPHSSLLAKRSADVDDGHRSKRSRDIGASSTNSSSSSSAASRGISSKGLSPSKSGRTPLKEDGRGGDRSSPVDGLSGRGVGRDLIGCVKPTAAVSASSAVGSKGLSASTHGALDLSSTDLSLQRFAALQQQLSLAAAAAAAGVRSPLYPHAALFASLDHGMSSSGSVGGSAAGVSSLAGLYTSPLGLPPTGYIGHPGALDPLSAYAASLQAASVGPSLYAEYAARLKAAAAATTCKDPYCIRCQLAATFQIPGLSGCGGASAAGAGEKQSASSGLMPPPPMLPPYLPSAASLHVLLQHLAAAGVEYPGPGAGSAVQSPAAPALYTCSWVDGASDFCGKRFVTSDELLQHLRTHASSNTDSAAAQSLLAPSQGFHPAALAAAFSAAFQSSTPGPLSPTTDASRSCNATSSCSSGTYSPTSLLASSRYNPYKPPSTSVFSPTGAGLAALPLPPLPAGSAGGASPGSAGAPPPPLFPSLAAYYSPYAALYGQRLGAAAAVGP